MSRIYFFTKGMTLCNALTAWYERILSCYSHMNQYFRGTYHTWLFIKNHTLPIPQSHCTTQDDVEWTYSNHVLSHQSMGDCYALSWLSVKLVIVEKNKEYDMDPFLSSFRISSSIPPTLTHVFLSWCAETKQWFSPSIVQFHVIDHNGEEQMLTLGADNDCLFLRGKKVYSS